MELEKHLESELRKAQQRLRHIVTLSPAVLFTLAVTDDQIQGITWISGNLREIHGYPPEVALGKDWFLSNIHPDDRDRVVAETHAELFTTGRYTGEYRFRHADGTYRWTHCDLRLIRPDTGGPLEGVGALLDITERKRAEEDQHKLREQLQQAQKLESVARLAGGAAHDFNNLLTVINGYSDLLLKQLDPRDPFYLYASEIKTAGERAAALSKQLLILSRRQVVQATEVMLNEVIAEVERMLDRVIGEDIRLKSLLNPNVGHVLADSGQLHQVLMNLAVNARDAMPAGGTLLIETDKVELDESYAQQHPQVKPGPYVRLRVSDTGSGMTKEAMAHLFEPFFTTKREGTGLGLATAYGIIMQCGGSISVYSELGQGTTFTIHLPRIDHVAAALPEPATPAAPTLRGTETILVAEDHEQVRNIAVRVLGDSGYKVLEAADAEEALRQSESYSEPIDLLLTDLVMPGMTGGRLAERIRLLRPTIQIVFMSAYSEPVIMDQLQTDSSTHFLQKPFSPEALVKKIRAVLGSPLAERTILIVDDEPGIRSFMGKILTGAGYSVLEARDGIDAVRQISRSDIQLVITDLAMPEREGLETIQILHRQRKRLKIIVMSGRFPHLLQSARHLGAHAVLKKPIQPDELLETVKGLMSKLLEE